MFNTISTGIVFIVIAIISARVGTVATDLVSGFLIALLSIKMLLSQLDKLVELSDGGIICYKALISINGLIALLSIVIPLGNFSIITTGRVAVDFTLVLIRIAILYLISNIIIELLLKFRYNNR